MYVVSRDQLRERDSFEGTDHGVDVSFLYVDGKPGWGPKLHQHTYAEIFIVLEGESMFTAGDEERLVHAGEIVVVPGDTPHKFYNAGEGILRQIDIHVSPEFVTEWLEPR